MEEVQEVEDNGSVFRPLMGAIGHCSRYFNKHPSYRANPQFNAATVNPVVIYCVHGTADRASSFDNFAEYLVQDLPDFIAGVRLVSFNDRAKGISIYNFAKQLKDLILAKGDQHVILLGHSRGGLVITHFAEYLAAMQFTPIHVLLVGPICAPYRGAKLAWKMLGLASASVNEMRIGSEYLQDLAEPMRASKLKYVIVGADSDKIVTLKRKEFLPFHVELGAENVLVLKNHGHLSAMSSQTMWQFVHGHIKRLEAPAAKPVHALDGVFTHAY